jgi:hypothetical protein
VEGELEVLRRRVVALRPAISPYTSEAEEKLARIRQHVAGMNGIDLPAKLRTVLADILGDA